MIDHLDSRALSQGDCYGQRFMRPGSFRYNIVPMGLAALNDHRPFVVHVADGSANATMKQHHVTVGFREGAFDADPAELRIATGDLILWNLKGDRSVPYSVVGDKEFFNSARLRNECGYTHAFGFPGEYSWVDAYGSKLSGIVRVTAPECRSPGDLAKWRERLAQGTLVRIVDDKAEPATVDIVTGQTVFFSVVKGPGVSITDRRLAGAVL